MITREHFEVVHRTCNYYIYGASCAHCNNSIEICDYIVCPKLANKAEKHTPMTPRKFADKMADIYEKFINKEDDEELAHGSMDDLMCQLLIDLGYEDGIYIFNNTPKWYA